MIHAPDTLVLDGRARRAPYRVLPPPAPLFISHRLYRRDHVLKLRDPLQRAVRRHRIVLSSFHDEVALTGLETVQEGFELVHGAL